MGINTTESLNKGTALAVIPAEGAMSVIENTDSNRAKEWQAFSEGVLEHVNVYTVPQYGDAPNDQMTTASVDDIKHNLTRYINRIGSNARGTEESLRDMIKIAHYACILHGKLTQPEAPKKATEESAA